MKSLKTLSIFFIFLLFNLSVICRPFLAERFNENAKLEESKSDEIIKILQERTKKNQVIVDLGAGGGYYSLRFAKEVVPEGVVYAVDIDKSYLDYIKELAEKEQIQNINYVLAKEDDPKLPPNIADLIFIRNVYHHLHKPEIYFKNLRTYLKPNARIVIIDYTLEHAPIAGFVKHGTDPKEILRVMLNNGYILEEEFKMLPKQSFFIFKIQQKD